MKKMDERGEALIHEALAIQESITEFKRRLESIEKAMEPYFPQASHVESLSTTEGTVIRVFDERIHVAPFKVPQVMAMLGSTFSKYFTLTPKAIPTAECLHKIWSADSGLGLALREHLTIKRDWTFIFSPTKSGRVVNYTEPEQAP